MATMIPKGIEEFKTDGERRFYRFLESLSGKQGSGQANWC
jgi:hypothetical protein